MDNELNKDFWDTSCHKCTSYGYVFSDNFERNICAICSTCGSDNALVFCPKCQVGSHLEMDLEDKPTRFSCPNCGHIDSFGDEFYKTKYTLHPESTIPREFILKLEEDSKQKRKAVFILVITLIIAIAFSLHYFEF